MFAEAYEHDWNTSFRAPLGQTRQDRSKVFHGEDSLCGAQSDGFARHSEDHRCIRFSRCSILLRETDERHFQIGRPLASHELLTPL